GSLQPPGFIGTAVGYLLTSFVFLLLVSRRIPDARLQTIIQVVTDIAVLVLLMHFSGGVRSGLGNLLLISIGAASLVLPQRTALTFVALASLAVLAEQSFSQFQGFTSAGDYTAAGLLGALIFIVSLATQPLARRITESEALAEQRGVDLANLAELNEYIVQHLRESIVVIDDNDRVRLMNSSAAKLLGINPETASGSHLLELAPPLYELAMSWRRRAGGEARNNLSSFTADDNTTLITPHFAPLGATEPSALLIFLEDATQLSERVQQTKLAGLGRLSASIAHEIRNPVGAISHAGQLLRESEAIGDDERVLTDIIHTQCNRVSTIIENVLQLSRRDNTRPQSIVLATWLDSFLDDFCSSNQLGRELIEASHDDVQMSVSIDPSHLHQVLWNLCENALRYASDDNGEVTLSLHSGRLSTSDRPYLEVLDRGSGIGEELIDRIFEPFVTGASDGTGLGLFIARELCECNHAALRYRSRQHRGSCFQIVFADPERWSA
ncbi:MAG: PAS domain-containing protein, partial [Gammaproteobacteria bacterium]|nr:PAS domain-containing protein [Gammaproteobacteria bacterium]